MAEIKPGHREIPDPTPMEIPAGFKHPESLAEMVQRLVRRQVSDAAEANGFESFEESEDFEIDDMFDPTSPYEEVFDPVLGRGITIDEFRRNEAVYRQRYEDAHDKAYRELELSDALRARRPAKQSGPQAAQEPVPKSPVPDGSKGS